MLLRTTEGVGLGLGSGLGLGLEYRVGVMVRVVVRVKTNVGVPLKLSVEPCLMWVRICLESTTVNTPSSRSRVEHCVSQIEH